MRWWRDGAPHRNTLWDCSQPFFGVSDPENQGWESFVFGPSRLIGPIHLLGRGDESSRTTDLLGGRHLWQVRRVVWYSLHPADADSKLFRSEVSLCQWAQ
jgi:hypothetical protein